MSVRFRSKERGTRVKLTARQMAQVKERGGDGEESKFPSFPSPSPSFIFGSRFISRSVKTENALPRSFLDCKTVGFFLKISKEIGNAWRKSLTRASHDCRAVEARELASLPNLALCFQPRSRPFV